MNQTKKTLPLLAAILLLPGLLSACSAQREGNHVDSGASSGGSKLAACMREKGYDMADPSDHSAVIQAPEGVNKTQWEDDFAGCSGVDGSGGGAGDAQQMHVAPDVDKNAKQFAECMRESGYEDFPDDLQEQPGYQPAGAAAAFSDDQERCGEAAFGKAGEKVER